MKAYRKPTVFSLSLRDKSLKAALETGEGGCTCQCQCQCQCQGQ